MNTLFHGRSLVAAILVVASCGGGSGTPATSDAAAQVGNNVSFEETQRELVNGIMLRTSEFQRTILEDGVVTQGEYESAILATVECVRKAGVRITDPVLADDGETLEYEYGFTAPDDVDGSARAEQEHARCSAEYVSDVNIVFQTKPPPTEEDLAAIRPIVVACMEGIGIDLNPDFAVEEAIEAILGGGPEALPCFDPFEPWN